MRSGHPRWFCLAAFAGFGLATALAAGCDSTSNIGAVTGGGGSSGAGGEGGSGGVLRKVDKIDIVLGIDNSASMADKQEVMSLALADMIVGLTSPPCLDASGHVVGQSNQGSCPSGSHLQYAAVNDIHVGVVTSSLGGHGSDSCGVSVDSPDNNDAGHLISRGVSNTYKNLGFVAWDPKAQLNPPGDSDLATFTGKVKDLVTGAGQEGCGFEAQLESWYRFLADPEPYTDIHLDHSTQTFVPSGIDQVLLNQRSAFLRPDSLLIIAMLSDENDCSTKEYGMFPIVNQLSSGNGGSTFHMPRARAICATNPDDPCCDSCGAPPPNGCGADPTCDGTALSDAEDPLNLRCWDQKRRFGIDFSYPADRYIAALTTPQVTNRAGTLVPNPIFSYIDGQDTSLPLRDPGLVILTGIVGVPWQDLARDPSDLTKGYKSNDELGGLNSDGRTTWSELLGDSTHAPGDPFMIESNAPRGGTNPFMGAPILPPHSTTLNPINGHEYDIEPTYGDLEYACTFALPTPRPDGADCTGANSTDHTDPVCDPNMPTIQIAAKAYPGSRQITVIQGLGEQGVVASICPKNQTDATSADYAYRPAMRAVLERVSNRLAPGE